MNVRQLIAELEKVGDQSAIITATDGDGARSIFPSEVIDKGFVVELRASDHHNR